MGIRGAINNDTVLALFGTTSKAFAATDFYTYTVVLTHTAFAFFPALICWSAFNIFRWFTTSWFGSWFDDG